MVYDPVERKWKGNTEALAAFNPSFKHIPHTTAAQPDQKGMVFDPQKLCWFPSQAGEEEDIFQDIPDFEIPSHAGEKMELDISLYHACARRHDDFMLSFWSGGQGWWGASRMASYDLIRLSEA